MRARSGRRRRAPGPLGGLLLLLLLAASLAGVLGTLFLVPWGDSPPGTDDGAATFGRSVIASGVTGVARTWFDGAFIVAAIGVPIVALPLCCVVGRARWVGLALGVVAGGCAAALGIGVASSGRPEEVLVGATIVVAGLLLLAEGVLIALGRASLACWLVVAVVVAVIVVHLGSTAQLVAIASGPLAPAVWVLCLPLAVVAAAVVARSRRIAAASRRGATR